MIVKYSGSNVLEVLW